MSHTYAILEVSRAAYDEVAGRPRAAGYGHCFHDDDGHDVIDMHGVALRAQAVAAGPTTTARTHADCPTCICGRRAPVQASGDKKWGLGTVAWSEHLLAWSTYAARYGRGQSAERMAERGGFGYSELQEFLGHEPTTWEPR